MLIDGKTVFPYLVLLTDGPPVFAFDARPIGEVTKVWLACWSKTATKSSEHGKVAAHAHIVNHAAAKKAETQYDNSEYEVMGPPICAPSLEEIFVLNGIPWRDGYGSLAVMAEVVKGVVYVDHEDLGGFRHRASNAKSLAKVEEPQ